MEPEGCRRNGIAEALGYQDKDAPRVEGRALDRLAFNEGTRRIGFGLQTKTPT